MVGHWQHLLQSIVADPTQRIDDLPLLSEAEWHQHVVDYVVMYRTAAHLSVATRDDVVSVDIAEGTTYFRQAGAEHNIINAGSNEVVFVEVELK